MGAGPGRRSRARRCARSTSRASAGRAAGASPATGRSLAAAAAAAFAAAVAFQVVVVDAAAAARGGHRELADAVAQVHPEAQRLRYAAAGLVDERRHHGAAHGDGGREEVIEPKAHAAALLGKVALHAQGVEALAALLALQLHLTPAVKCEGLHAPHRGEVVGAAHPAAHHPALVGGVEVAVGHVVDKGGVVGVDARVQVELGAPRKVGKQAAAVGPLLPDVGVRSLDGIDAAHRAQRFDGAGGVAHKRAKIQVQGLVSRAVAQLEVVGVFGGQGGVAAADVLGICGVDVGVEELQRGALNALVVRQLQHVAVVQLAREVHAGHQHAVVGDVDGRHRVGKVRVDDGVFVAQARLDGEAVGQGHGVGGVGGRHVLAVVELVVVHQAHACPGRQHLAVGPKAHGAVVRVHAAQNVFGAQFQNLGFANRVLVVELHGVLFVVARVVVLDAARAVGFRVEDFVGKGVGAVVAAEQREQAELVLRLLKQVRVVQAGVHGAREVLHGHVAPRKRARRAGGRRPRVGGRGQAVLVVAGAAGAVGHRRLQGIELVEVVIPAQGVAPKNLLQARVGGLRGGGGRAAGQGARGLHVRELARRVVLGPPEAAQRKAHLAGAQVAVQAQVAAAQARARVHAQGGAAQVVGFGDDVDDAARAFGVVLGRGRGDDLHGLNLVGRNLLQRVGNAAGGNGRGLVVDEHPDAGAAAQAHVAVQVHAQQGHALEHVGGVAAAGGLVVLGVVDGAVHPLLDDGLLAGHHYFAQLLGGGGQADGAQIGGAAGRHHHAGALLVFVADEADLHRVGAGRNAGQDELAVVAGHAAVHHFTGAVQHGHRGVRHGLARPRLRHGTGDAAGGSPRCWGSDQSRWPRPGSLLARSELGAAHQGSQ